MPTHTHNDSPIAARFTIHGDGTSTTFLEYPNRSTTPLPAGKSYIDYLSKASRKNVIRALADLIVQDILGDDGTLNEARTPTCDE